jgi:cap1 methyltransferase
MMMNSSSHKRNRVSRNGDILKTDAAAFDSNFPRSSWFDDSAWLQSTGVGEEQDTTMHDDKQTADSKELSEEIASLQQQLCQLKRRLGPAAEKAAAARNALLDRTTMDQKATTASREFERARRRCNPYEILGEGRQGGLNNLFMNRSAVKLANIDALIGQTLTQCYDDNRRPFCFVDLCGAPGGFSEYVMYRCRERGVYFYRGYGMSLHGCNEHGRGLDWRLDHMESVRGGSLSNFHVCGGKDGTGDIYSWDNVRELQKDISVDMTRLTPIDLADVGRAHLVVADGGFDAQRDSECQEELAQKLVVCEAAAAIALLRPGGTLVLKMFGFQTDLVRSLMGKLHRMFQSMIVLKPISSRPASAERYAVFAGFAGTPADFDGLSWRNDVLLAGVDVDKTLLAYLDKFDRNLLELNVKTCFEILTHLEQIEGDILSDQELTYSVDVKSYRRAWAL